MDKQLSIDEQLDLLHERGLDLNPSDRDRDLHSVEVVGYYKLKEFAYPFSKIDKDGTLTYNNISFSELITRYYQDKNLRIYLLHAIEDIEVTLNNRLAYLLGDKYGAYGYLRFSNWCDRSRKKFEIEGRQYFFKKDLLKKVKRSNLRDIQQKENQQDDFPSVWLMIDTLTFGETVNLLRIMAKTNLKIIAAEFDCTSGELLSWLGCLNLVRNICCHNADILDIKFTTKPKIPRFFQDDIYINNGKYSNSIALAVYITAYLMKNVNPKYKFQDVISAFNRIIKNNPVRANSLGFRKVSSIREIKKKLK